MANGKFIAYFRVSTARQGQSGLGLEAQRKAVADFIAGNRQRGLFEEADDLVAEFTEVESGRRNDRPELAKALAEAKRTKAKLVIAKLDRLARNVHFISGLLESKVEFVAVDMPEADRAFLQMAAVFAEWEARKISERTKAALAAAKAKGRALGWSIPSRQAEQAEAARKGATARKTEADRFAMNVLPIVESIKAAGIGSLAGIAEALNARGIKTARGGAWYPMTVRNMLHRQHAEA